MRTDTIEMVYKLHSPSSAIKVFAETVADIDDECNSPIGEWWDALRWGKLIATSRTTQIRLISVEPKLAVRDAVGFVVWSCATKTKQVSLMRIGVRWDYQCRGIGSLLLKQLEIVANRRKLAVGCLVQERNIGLQEFLAARGFEATCVYRDFFLDAYALGVAPHGRIMNYATQDGYLMRREYGVVRTGGRQKTAMAN